MLMDINYKKLFFDISKIKWGQRDVKEYVKM